MQWFLESECLCSGQGLQRSPKHSTCLKGVDPSQQGTSRPRPKSCVKVYTSVTIGASLLSTCVSGAAPTSAVTRFPSRLPSLGCEPPEGVFLNTQIIEGCILCLGSSSGSSRERSPTPSISTCTFPVFSFPLLQLPRPHPPFFFFFFAGENWGPSHPPPPQTPPSENPGAAAGPAAAARLPSLSPPDLLCHHCGRSLGISTLGFFSLFSSPPVSPTGPARPASALSL